MGEFFGPYSGRIDDKAWVRVVASTTSWRKLSRQASIHREVRAHAHSSNDAVAGPALELTQ
jgi:hypothetical protein